jgi:SAM-dependent methyltransferase
MPNQKQSSFDQIVLTVRVINLVSTRYFTRCLKHPSIYRQTSYLCNAVFSFRADTLHIELSYNNHQQEFQIMNDFGHNPEHVSNTSPSPWVVRFAPLVAAGGAVMDVACGGGRHSRFFAERGHPVLAMDRDISKLGEVAGIEGVTGVEADLEYIAPFEAAGENFAGIVVTNYRGVNLVKVLASNLRSGGVLIYETFAVGNERFGKPSSPDFLLKPDELLKECLAENLTVIAYEFGDVDLPKPTTRQRICALKMAEDQHPVLPGYQNPD